MEDDRTYYARRAREERRAADGAGDADARLRHLELAGLLSAKSGPPAIHRSAAASHGRTSAT